MAPSPQRLLAFRVILAAVSLAGILTALVLGVIVWDVAHPPDRGPTETSLKLEAGRVVCAGADLAPCDFPAAKPAGEFRVFVFGGSAAQGAPFVHSGRTWLVEKALGAPNRGGMTFWIERFLTEAAVAPKVRAVNLARGGGSLAQAVETMRQAMALGRPDVLVLMSGNNEFNADPPEWATPEEVEKRTPRYLAGLRAAADLVAGTSVQLYVLTVPNDVRTYPPERLRYDVQAGAAGPDDPIRDWHRGRALLRRGDAAAAAPLLFRAHERDLSLRLARRPWNDAIRALRGPNLHVLDMERRLRDYDPDGIPGGGLFVDRIHLTLWGNMILGFETARAIAARRGRSLDARRISEDEVRELWGPALRRLYWAKRFQQKRLRWFGRLSEADRLNSQLIEEEYKRLSRETVDP